MIYNSMNEYALQSYFKKLCNIYYFAYEQMELSKKAENEADSIAEDPVKEWQEIVARKDFWTKEFIRCETRISEILKVIYERKFHIIITSREEVYALISIGYSSGPRRFRVINTKEEYLRSFPEDEMSKEFLEAYLSEDDEKMIEVINKYY